MSSSVVEEEDAGVEAQRERLQYPWWLSSSLYQLLTASGSNASVVAPEQAKENLIRRNKQRSLQNLRIGKKNNGSQGQKIAREGDGEGWEGSQGRGSAGREEQQRRQGSLVSHNSLDLLMIRG